LGWLRYRPVRAFCSTKSSGTVRIWGNCTAIGDGVANPADSELWEQPARLLDFFKICTIIVAEKKILGVFGEKIMCKASYSRCCEDSICVEDDGRCYCDICGEELDEYGYPLCESEEEISEDDIE
jgi:hypothetical protein